MPEPKTGPIPESLRLETNPEYCDEENAIQRFVNGDTTIDQFMDEVDDAYGQKQG